MNRIEHRYLTAIAIAALGHSVGCLDAQAEILRQGRTTALRVPSQGANSGLIDYANAIPKELPIVPSRGGIEIQTDFTSTSRGSAAHSQKLVQGHPGTGK